MDVNDLAKWNMKRTNAMTSRKIMISMCPTDAVLNSVRLNSIDDRNRSGVIHSLGEWGRVYDKLAESSLPFEVVDNITRLPKDLVQQLNGYGARVGGKGKGRVLTIVLNKRSVNVQLPDGASDSYYGFYNDTSLTRGLYTISSMCLPCPTNAINILNSGDDERRIPCVQDLNNHVLMGHVPELKEFRDDSYFEVFNDAVGENDFTKKHGRITTTQVFNGNDIGHEVFVFELSDAYKESEQFQNSEKWYDHKGNLVFARTDGILWTPYAMFWWNPFHRKMISEALYYIDPNCIQSRSNNERDVGDLMDAMGNMFDSKRKNLEYKYSRELRRAESIREEYITVLKELDEISVRLQAYKNASSGLVEKGNEQIMRLRRNPKINGIYGKNNCIMFVFGDLKTKTRYGTRYQLPDIAAIVNFENGNVMFKSNNPVYCRDVEEHLIHPHVRGGGQRVCFGHVMQVAMAEAIRHMDIEVIASLLIQFLEQSNIDDVWGSVVTNFPRVKKG